MKYYLDLKTVTSKSAKYILHSVKVFVYFNMQSNWCRKALSLHLDSVRKKILAMLVTKIRLLFSHRSVFDRINSIVDRISGTFLYSVM